MENITVPVYMRRLVSMSVPPDLNPLWQGLGQSAGHPQHRTDFILRRGGGGAVSIYNGASSIVWLRVIGKEDVVIVLGCPCFMLVILLRVARLLAQGTNWN